MKKGNFIVLTFRSHQTLTELSVLILNYLRHNFNLDDDDYFKIEISLREAVINAIRHGNKGNPDKNVTVEFRWEKNYISIRVKDENDERVDFSKIENRLQKSDLLSFSGRGIMIMKSYMDRVDINSTPDGVEIVMEKRWP
jgi:serine/threonine-protein kinase RsbW